MPPLVQVRQARQLFFAGRHHQLSANFVRDRVFPAKRDHLTDARHRQLRLQRPGLVIQPRVQHAAVVSGLVPAHFRLFLEHRHHCPCESFLHAQRGREPYNSTADYEHPLGSHHPLLYSCLGGLRLELRSTARAVLILSWIAIAAIIAIQHRRVREARLRSAKGDENGALRDSASLRGLAVEGLGYVIALAAGAPVANEPRFAASMFLAIAAVALMWAGVRQLGLEFRIKAVVTRDHSLVTAGPYALIRHPIYLSMLLFLLANGLYRTWPPALALALAVYIAGTEIRVRAEDNLLSRRFGPAFDDYRRRVAAYIPFIR